MVPKGKIPSIVGIILIIIFLFLGYTDVRLNNKGISQNIKLDQSLMSNTILVI